MIFLNLGCGGCRPPYRGAPAELMAQGTASPWVNIDDLYKVFPDPNWPERVNLDAEFNYKNYDLNNRLDFPDNHADGILASHFLEHLTLQECLKLLKECKRVLKPGGVLRISIPDAKKFHALSVLSETQTVDWGEKCPHTNMTFLEWALFFFEHKQVLSAEGIFCMLWPMKFSRYAESKFKESWMPGLEGLDNRPVFSVFVEAMK